MHEEENYSGLEGMQMMGIVSALKTGNVQLDMLIAMCIPLLLRFLFSNVESLGRKIFDSQAWQRWLSKKLSYHERFLVYRSLLQTAGYRSRQTNLDEDTQNAVLMKAIKLYTHCKCNLEMEAANLELTSTENDSFDDCYDSDDEGDYSKTLVGMLSGYKLVKQPLNNQWQDLGKFGREQELHKVELQVIENEETANIKGKNCQVSTRTYHLRSTGATAIDDFVKTAYDWYLDELRKSEDNSRHMYELQTGGDASYKQYKLSDEKTFDSLFFQQKESLLAIVDHFATKSGKFAIKGYPHKLGLLLHGPPGTGKTSLIKALAHYTDRSIVNVPLSKIKTNTMLQAVFFDHRYHVQDEYVPVKLGFKDVIFVLEDVDAASNVVKRRDGKKTSEITQTESVALTPPKSIWRMLLESADNDCQKLVEELMQKSDRLKLEALKDDVTKSLVEGISSLPGLSLVGTTDPTLAKIGEEAIEFAAAAMDGRETVDQYLSMHVKPLKALLDKGAEVGEALVNELLSLPGSCSLGEPRQHQISREISYELTGTNDDSPEIFFKDSEENLMAAVSGPSTKSSTMDGLSKKLISSSFDWMDKDRLSLDGLLNVLDGVVDTPGRMVIMTSNHPELLDPALIRPGRIDKKILLGCMAASDIIKMLEHYFMTTLTNQQRLRIDAAVNGNPAQLRPRLNLTPAQVEQMAAEYDELDDMIHSLEEKGRSRIHHGPWQNGARKLSHSEINYGL